MDAGEGADAPGGQRGDPGFYKVFDHYVDFDKAVRDPYDAQKLRPGYDSGDHLHPSDAGFRRMGESFDLSLLRKTAPAQL